MLLSKGSLGDELATQATAGNLKGSFGTDSCKQKSSGNLCSNKFRADTFFSVTKNQRTSEVF